MSGTPQKILLITIKLSAAELEKANNVAFMVSEPSCKAKTVNKVWLMYLQFPSF